MSFLFVQNACLDNERALSMVALAGNFHLFAPRLTARLAAVLLGVLNIAAAWNVRAFLVLLVYHAVLVHERRTAPGCYSWRRVFLCTQVAIKIPTGRKSMSGYC